MQFLTSWINIGKGSVIAAVISALVFLYNSYTGMQVEIQNLKVINAGLQTRMDTVQASLDLQIRNQQQADSMYLELKSVYATLDKKLANNKATLDKLRSEKGTQNEKLLNYPLTPDIVDIANGVRNP